MADGQVGDLMVPVPLPVDTELRLDIGHVITPLHPMVVMTVMVQLLRQCPVQDLEDHTVMVSSILLIADQRQKGENKSYI